MYTSPLLLNEKGIIFCPISEAIQEHPELIKKYMGSIVNVKAKSITFSNTNR